MGKTIHEVVMELSPFFNFGNSNSASRTEARSRTSLCALLFNGGCLVYSDMQETHGSERPYKSSTRERKIYKVGDDDILLAGTGSSAGIIMAARRAHQAIKYWRSEHELEPIPPEKVSEILSKIMNPEHEAQFLLGGYDPHHDQGMIATISDDGTLSQSHFFQVNGSGSPYMLAKARTVEKKALGSMYGKIQVTSQIYDALPALAFSREVAMIEGLDIINAGPENDVFSGGKGFQLAVLDKNGVQEYIIPKDKADEILDLKHTAEHSALNPLLKAKQFTNYPALFEQYKQSSNTWWIQ